MQPLDQFVKNLGNNIIFTSVCQDLKIDLDRNTTMPTSNITEY